MKNFYLFFAFFALTLAAYSQGPTIDIGSDTITCPPGCITLTADYEGGGNTTDYTQTVIAYAPDPYAGTSRFLSDDGTLGALPIGFSFCFYGNTYTNYYIGANGWISFTPTTGAYTPYAIPTTSAAVPKNCIMGPWHDLNPGVGGSIKTQTLGVAPYRRLVVTWESMPFFSCTGTLNTQQIIIYETTNVIENHIQTKLTCPSWVGGRAVQGVHNLPGTLAVPVAGRNNTVWTASNHAVRYTPIGDPIVEWYAGPIMIGTGLTKTVCPAVPSTYVAKLISCGGIVAMDTVFVDVICCEPPTMTHTDVTCFGGCDGTGTAEGIGVAPFTYLWDAAAGSQTTATAVDLCPGTYEVTVTDALGCEEIGEVVIAEPEEITVFIDAINIVSCFGLTDGSVYMTGSGGTGELTYDIGDGPVAVGEFTDLAPGLYTVVITDENGCTKDVPVEIVSPALLEAVEVDVIDLACNGGSDGEIVIAGTGGLEPYSFSISGGAFGASGTFSGLGAGSYDLEVKDANDCIGSITLVINEPPALTLTLVASTDVTCFGGADGEITIVAGGGTPVYSYSIDGGPFAAGTTFTGLSAGSHTVTVKDANDCELDLSVVLTGAPAVTVDETVVGESCLGDCLGAITLAGDVGVAPFLYSIDGCATTDPDGIYDLLCAGSYDICVVDANGCEYNGTLAVAAGVVPADASITPFGPLCVNAPPVTLSAVSPGGVYSGPGVVGGVFNPALAGPGTHTITNTISIGCGDVATFNVVVNPRPVVSFSSATTSGCEPLTVNFAYVGDPGVDCVWDFGDGTLDFCGSSVHTFYNDGVYDISYTVTDANGCTNSSTLYDYIDVYPTPNAVFRFGPQPTTTINTNINFTDMSSDADSWDWTFGDLGNSNDQNPSFFFPEIAGEYTIDLVVSNAYGCRDSTSQLLIISEQYLIYVPNAITPDGDLYNEVFKPYFNGIDIYNYSLMIYNRWGEVVFESHNLDVGWNGTYGGEIVESGVYIWHIITDEAMSDKKLEYHGHVTVLK